jgi:putative membrane protein
VAYDDLGKEKPILRDYLAAERTHLANERTLLAYLRSALFVLIAALTILKFFEGDSMMRIVSFVLGPLSILIGIFGVYRFRRTRNKLAVFEKQMQAGSGQ